MDDRWMTSTRAAQTSVPWRTAGNRKRKPLVLESDLNALRGGHHAQMYDFLGAHADVENGIHGVRFGVWAPNATEVSVLCDQNYWQSGHDHLFGSDTGIWSGFVPGLKPGMAYKFGVRTRWGQVLEKADPFAFHAELRPQTASIIYDIDHLDWHDQGWMSRREQTNWLEQPVSIYEVHLGSWKRPKDGRKFFNYRELAHMLVQYVQEMGYTHIELMPISEHPFDGSWGYQTVGQFAATSRFGTPDDFAYFVDYCHQANIGVIIDWVPAHFPIDAHGLAQFDGTCLYEHADPRQGFHPDWGTLVFNFGRTEVRNFLLSSARFWLDKYHIDGLRVDAVASMLYLDYSRKAGEWIPNQHGGRENLEAVALLQDMNTLVHRDFPGILTIAEESTAWGGVSRPVYMGGLGFSMKWDMGWMNDTLRYMDRDPIHRQHHHGELSFRMVYAFTENFALPLSHDEVVHGKRSLLSQMPGDPWQKFANLRLLYSYQYTTPGKKLLFMGGELGQWHEWQHEGELDWGLEGNHLHDGLRKYVSDLNHVYRDHAPLYEVDFTGDGFDWLLCDDCQNSVFAFVRYAKDPTDYVICVLNFVPMPHGCYRIGVPKPGYYAEILNSDAGIYGGSNAGNLGGVYSQSIPSHGRAQSIEIQLPPLGMVLLKPVGPKG